MMSVLVMYTGLPEVTVVPPSHSVEVTHSVKFTATVHGVGKENFTYQWRHNGVNIERETHNTLTIVNVTVNHSGNYDCVVMSKLGDCVTSNTSELSKEFAELLYYYSGVIHFIAIKSYYYFIMTYMQKRKILLWRVQ